MKKFKQYPSIEGSSSVYSDLDSNCTYCLTEKVHGANFAFHVFPKGETQWDIQVAKRTSYLESDQEKKRFFPGSVDHVYEKYKKRIEKVCDVLLHSVVLSKGLERVIIFGELMGGFYPGAEENMSKRPVQIGVYYCNEFDFYPFDVRIIYKDGSQWLTHKDFCELMKTCGFVVYAKPLIVGSLNECLKYKYDGCTKVPSMFYPHLIPNPKSKDFKFVKNDNQSEGVVLKPYDEVLYGKKGERIIVKLKNEAFIEVVSGGKKKTPKPDKKWPVDAQKIRNEIIEYFTISRIETTISKIGSIDSKARVGELIGAYAIDVMDDYVNDHPEAFEKLSPESLKFVKKYVGGKSGKFIKQNGRDYFDM